MIEGTFSVGLSCEGKSFTFGSLEVGNTFPVLNQTFPAGTTNAPVSLALALANVQGILIVADVDMTLKTNNATTPTDTIALKANRAYFWRKSDGYGAIIFTADVSSAFVSCTPAGRLRIFPLVS